MALAITSPVATVADTSNLTSYATASFTPTANSFLIVFIKATATLVGSISGGSLTWTTQRSGTGGGDAHFIFTAPVGSSPSSMTIVYDCTADAATGCLLKTYQVTGHNTTTPVIQSQLVSNATTGADPVITPASAMGTNNAYMAVLWNGTNPFAATPPTNWTETDDTGFGSPAAGLEAAYRINGETGTTITFTAVSSTWRSAFIEIAPAAIPNKIVQLNQSVKKASFF